MTTGTAFLWDERCFWHAGGNYAQLAPVGGLVQPMVAGGLPEAPETKRRLKNLMDVSGLSSDLHLASAARASDEQLRRVHPASYLESFKSLSDKGGGELGLRTPFGPGAYEIAALSAGLVVDAVAGVLEGRFDNAYALSRPPGHHCMPDWPNGFCLLANVAIAVRDVQARKLAQRIAVVDWDVHHGNGTEHIFYNDPDVLTISIHQERCYPQDTGMVEHTGEGAGAGANMNIPLVPGSGHETYLYAMEKLVLPKLREFKPELIVVASGFDAAIFDPLSRMMCTAETFSAMTAQLMGVEGAKFAAAHEGGYSEMYVPFCGHAMLEQMSGSEYHAADPMKDRANGQQPSIRVNAFQQGVVDELTGFFNLN